MGAFSSRLLLPGRRQQASFTLGGGRDEGSVTPARRALLSGLLPGKKKRLSFESARLERYASNCSLHRLKMERQSLRSPVITPPQDFRDDDSSTTSPEDEQTILEPPVMFQQPDQQPALLRSVSLGQRAERPKTDLFWTARPGSWKKSVPQDVNEAFREELERLKSHSLLLRFPADGAARVHYRSSKSVVVQHVASINQYR